LRRDLEFLPLQSGSQPDTLIRDPIELVKKGEFVMIGSYIFMPLNNMIFS